MRRPDRAGEEAREKGWHPWLGAHFSIAGGFASALEAAHRLRARAVQIFTKPASQWNAKPLDPSAVARFRESSVALGPFETAVHASYLINLASPETALRRRSLEAFRVELERCEALGVPRLVFHPGSHVGEGEGPGLARVADALRASLAATAGYRVRLLVENTAGQGTNLGADLDHLRILLDRVEGDGRLRVCLDTCHLLAAGYELRDDESYASLVRRVERTLGPGRVDLLHLNDSVHGLGSRKDRHANIGEGEIGGPAFARFLRDPVFRGVPAVVETPVEGDGHARDLRRLRRLSRIVPGRGRGAGT